MPAPPSTAESLAIDALRVAVGAKFDLLIAAQVDVATAIREIHQHMDDLAAEATAQQAIASLAAAAAAAETVRIAEATESTAETARAKKPTGSTKKW